MKKKFPTELCYALGLLCLAVGATLMIRADFGLTMIVAPAYVMHAKLEQTFSWLTLGMMEYLWQGVLLLSMMLIVRRVRLGYLFAFITAVIFGFLLDGCLALSAYLPTMIGLRIVYYSMGTLVCSLGVAFVFRTYIAPEVHELLVKEIASKFSKQSHHVKMGYDIFCCVAAITLSLVFFSELVGIGWGTIICALINGTLIGIFSKWLDRHFEFTDALPLRRMFER